MATIHGFNTPMTDALAAALAEVNVNIRWGGPMVPGAVNGECHLLNGLEQLKAFKAAGLSTVHFTESREERDRWVDRGEYVMGRKLNHTQGFDIVFPGTVSANRRWQSRDFWVRYSASLQEWRIHVMKNPITGEYNSIARGLKVRTGPDPRAPRLQGFDVRSRRLGWTLSHTAAPPEGVRDLAKKALAAVGYDFGAVDLLDLNGEHYQLLEVNSRPAIRDDYTLAAYTKGLKRYGKTS